jgi:hypothetical protein
VQLAPVLGGLDACQKAAVKHIGRAQVATHGAVERDFAADARDGVQHQAQEPDPLARRGRFARTERVAVDRRHALGVAAALREAFAPQPGALRQRS